MIKLDLLDRRFAEGSRIKRAAVVSTLLTALLVAGLLWQTGQLKEKDADMKTQAAQAAGFESAATSAQAEIDGVKATFQPFDDRLTFLTSVLSYGDNFPKHLRMLSRYIYNRAEVLNAQIQPDGFSLSVRTKTTADVAALMVNLKQAYKAGLIAQDSLSITGLSGWPNPTSPRGWGPNTKTRVELPAVPEGLSGVNSNSTGGAAASSSLPGSGGMGSGSSGMGSGGMGSGGMGSGGSPPMSGGSGGSPPMSGGSGGAPPMASGGGAPMSSAGGLQIPGLDLQTAQFFVGPEGAAFQAYIKPSDEPPAQPYLNLAISGRWAVPFGQPRVGAGGAQGGMGGMGMGGGMGMSGSPAGGPPMGGPGGSGGGTPMGGPGGSGR